MQNRIPDFTSPDWKLAHILDFVAVNQNNKPDYLKIGKQDIYFNNRTGEMGMNITSTRNSFLIYKTWEKKLWRDENLTTLYYLGVRSDGQWKIHRLKSQEIEAVVRKDDSGKNLGVEIIFTLITEMQKSFFVPMELISAL